LDRQLINRFSNILKETNQPVCIIVHTNPDGDAIGSALALFSFLKKIGFNDIQVVAPNRYASFLHWIPGSDQVIIATDAEKEAHTAIEKAKVMFCLDFNGFARADQLKTQLESSKAIKIMIDHHPSPEPGFDLVFSDIAASSTAELVFELIEAIGLGMHIDATIAQCLYAGIVTDTGSFSFSCNNPRTYEIVAELMRTGIDGAAIQRLIYSTYSIERMRLLGYCLGEKLTIIEGFDVAYISLSKKELKDYNYKEGDTEGVVNYALSIEGINMAAMFVENEDHIKASFRSAGNIDVNLFARSFYDGGGHLNAAGGKSYSRMEDTLKDFEALIKKGVYR